jgi:hypothetical protein
MPEPYKMKVANNEGVEVTSVVLDVADFNALCDEILDRSQKVMEIKSGKRIDTDTMAAIKEAGHIPLVYKGTVTAWIFEKFDIDTDLAGFCSRGFASRLEQQLRNDLKNAAELN